MTGANSSANNVFYGLGSKVTGSVTLQGGNGADTFIIGTPGTVSVSGSPGQDLIAIVAGGRGTVNIGNFTAAERVTLQGFAPTEVARALSTATVGEHQPGARGRYQSQLHRRHQPDQQQLRLVNPVGSPRLRLAMDAGPRQGGRRFAAGVSGCRRFALAGHGPATAATVNRFHPAARIGLAGDKAMHAQMPEPVTPTPQPGMPPDLPEFPSPINDPAPNDLPPLEMPPDGDPMGTPIPPQMRQGGRLHG